jgi:hypothetical protein
MHACTYSLKLITVKAAASYYYFGTVLQGRFNMALDGNVSPGYSLSLIR